MNQLINKLLTSNALKVTSVVLLSSFFWLTPSSALNYTANIEKTIETEEADIDLRIFKAEGNKLLIGFACDQGSSKAEEMTSQSLANDGIEVWMPDMLSAYMLPKVRSSIGNIPTDGIVKIVEAAIATGKKVYLVASGPDTELILRVAQRWEADHKDVALGGAILMFPRLNKSKPEPGKAPVYQDAVGKTQLPIMVLEGERTPNRWGIGHLTNSLKKGGSTVYAKLIPSVRGYFFKREDANTSENLATEQMPGLIKASLFFLGKANEKSSS